MTGQISETVDTPVITHDQMVSVVVEGSHPLHPVSDRDISLDGAHVDSPLVHQANIFGTATGFKNNQTEAEPGVIDGIGDGRREGQGFTARRAACHGHPCQSRTSQPYWRAEMCGR